MPGLFNSILKNANPIGMVSQGLSSIFGIASGFKMMKEAKKIKPVYTPYQTSQYAKNQLGGAQMRYNARSAQSEAAKRGVASAQATTMAQAQRSSSDPSRVMAMAAASQEQAGNQMEQIATQDEALQQQKFADLQAAQSVMVGEDRVKYQDMLNKYQMDLEQKNSLRSAGQQNVVGGLTGLAGAAFTAGMFGQGAGVPKATYQHGNGGVSDWWSTASNYSTPKPRIPFGGGGGLKPKAPVLPL